MPNTNRNKGNRAEVEYMNKFKELGYQNCVTSRYGGKLYDDTGIDLMNIPLNVQIKAGKQRGLKPDEILKDLDEKVINNFGQDSSEASKINVLIHKREVGRGKKRTKYDDLIIMSFDDFKEFIRKS